MRVTLRLELDCTADEAWELLHESAGMRYCLGPWLRARMLDGSRMPARWEEGPGYPIELRLLGLLPVGEARVELGSETRGETRILTDDGGPVAGLLGTVGDWRHRMAVTPAPSGRTLYRDRLDTRGPIAIAMWPMYWAMWQWRGMRIQRLAARRGRKAAA
ncbi:hypothetical protein [Homoserinibacter sp. YIM 151385]|uniref:hypothetical protein n=1 Tax=Homoserinibacter sp. YIM 151385 TaxID=2985506 RepID=UPI0022EFE44A|nr:hypothetical protein [Homoserinibacter sp. YIM 151385]WBU37629.1 hypothetical protein OF852_12015 [Homoserinibacter sp. YIM 151385]